MEAIYSVENFGSSINFPLKRYFDEYITCLKDEEKNTECDAKNLTEIKRMMNVDIDLMELQRLSQSCSVDTLTCEGENIQDFPMELPANLNSSSKFSEPYISTKKSVDLSVIKCRNELEHKRSTLELLLGNKRNYHKNLELAIPSTPPDLKPGSEFVLSILIYRPFTFKYFRNKNASENLRFSHEILALGRNTLAELRDKIICSADEGLLKEVESTAEDLKRFAEVKSKYPSGFIFIDNCFYNDFRDPNAIDISAPIMKWAKEKNIKDLQTTSIENVRLDSLTPRFGYPYLYMHQGDCEHLLAFSDARLLQRDDCLHSECYPHVLKLNRSVNRMCFMCTEAFAKWICIDGDRFPQNKVFLCTDCCNSYNYIDGKKVGNFKLYPYYEKHVTT